MRLMPVGLRVLVLCVVVAVAASLFVPTPAPAQSELDAAAARVARATERLEVLLAERDEAQRQGNELAAAFWLASSELEVTDRAIAEREAALADLVAQRAGLLGEVRSVALDRYMSAGDDLFVRDTIWDDPTSVADREAAVALAELFVGSDESVLDQLAATADAQERAVAALAAARDEQAIQLEATAQAQTGIERELAALTTVQDALQTELSELESALAELEAAEARRQAAAEEAARLAEQRQRAEAAAARAAAHTPPTPEPVVPPTALPVAPEPEPTVPNPTPSVPLGGGAAPEPTVPNPTPSVPLDGGAAPEPTVPNPTPSVPLGGGPAPEPTVPNPTPSVPLDGGAAPEPTVPNPTPSVPLATGPTPAPTAVPTVPNPVPSRSGIVCPLAGAFTHTDDFNAPRAVGGVHRANDLIAATGTPVLAVVSGVVEHKEARVGGLSVHLKADNGDYYFYTHLNGYENVGIGRVQAGTVVGYVGMTGNAPIPHLHFEIHRGGYGNYVNPYGEVRAACGT